MENLVISITFFNIINSKAHSHVTVITIERYND